MPVYFIPSGEQVVERQKTTARKRRRNQNTEIEELGDLLPFKPDSGKNMDKISILRLASTYIKFQNFMTKAYGENQRDNRNILTELLSQAMDGFLLVLGDDATIFYASDNLQKYVGMSPRDVIGHTLFDLVESERDNETIQENLKPKGIGENQYRMFYIRLRNAATPGRVKVSRYNTHMMLQVSGHLKVHVPSDPQPESPPTSSDGTLVPVPPKEEPGLPIVWNEGRGGMPKLEVLGLVVECRPIEASSSVLELSVPQLAFSSTVGLDFKVQTVDTRVREALGFDPNDFIGTTIKDYFHPLDHAKMLPCKELLARTGYTCSPIFRFMNSSGEWTWVQLEGTMQYKEGTREPQYMDVLFKIMNQSEGKLKYIEQQEIFAKECKKEDNASVDLHCDQYHELLQNTHFNVSEGHMRAAERMKGADLSESAIGLFLQCRSKGLNCMSEMVKDVVSTQEEAEELADSYKQQTEEQLDWSVVFSGGKFDVMEYHRAARELVMKQNREKSANSPSSPSASVDSPAPSSVSTAPSPGLQAELNQDSPAPTLEQGSVSSPNSVLSAQLSPDSILSAPNSVLSAEPSPIPVPADTSGSDSGIDSPTSSSGESNSGTSVPISENGSSRVPESGNGGPSLVPQDGYALSSLLSPDMQSQLQETTAATVVKSEQISQPTDTEEQQAPFSSLSPQENGNSYAYPSPPSLPPSVSAIAPSSQPQLLPPWPVMMNTEIPPSFQFGTEMQDSGLMSFQGDSVGGESLDSLLSDLGMPAPGQNHPAPGQNHEWWTRNQQLQQQIQQQQQLLQQLLLQQQQLHQQQPLQQPLPQQQMTTYDQPDVNLTSQLDTRSISPSISPLPSATPSPYYNHDAFQSPPLPPPTHFDHNGYQNGQMHTTTNNVSLLPPQQTNSGQIHTTTNTNNASLLPPQQQTNGCQTGPMHTIDTNATPHPPLDSYQNQNRLIHTNTDQINDAAHQSLSFVGSFSLMPPGGQNSSANDIDITQELLQHLQQ